MKYLLLAVILALFGCATKETSKPVPTPTPTIPSNGCDLLQSRALSSPWKDSKNAIVIDAYESNPIDWDAMAKDKRVVGVIHRSAYGMRKDTQYVKRMAIAKSRGYLWGAYHLGTPGNVKAQADLLLSMAPDKEDLIVLDLEDTTNSSKFMSIPDAVLFVEYVHAITGRIPVIYANHSTTRLLNQKYPNHPLLKKSGLWYARFKSSVTDFPTGIWNGYFLWQFSSEINCSTTGSCLYNVPGTKFDMDVNVFGGSYEQLKSMWRNDCY